MSITFAPDKQSFAPDKQSFSIADLEEKVIQAAAENGIAIDLTDSWARESVVDENNYEQTPQMSFEDVLEWLQAIEAQATLGLENELVTTRLAALDCSEAITRLRDTHNIENLTKLEEVKVSLRERVQELELKPSKGKQPT